jgi:citrate lyase subunit beta/citryl-CoA lyase
VAFGAEDFTVDIGARRTESNTEISYVRERLVLAAAAAGLDAIDMVGTDVGATDRLHEETEAAVDLGYDGKICTHPSQVPVVNEACTSDDDRVDWARRVLAAAAETDRGAFRVDGEMIHAPLVRRAEQVRERARVAGVW